VTGRLQSKQPRMRKFTRSAGTEVVQPFRLPVEAIAGRSSWLDQSSRCFSQQARVSKPMIDPQFAPEKLLNAISGANNSALGAQSPLPSNRSGIISPYIVLDGRTFSIRVKLGKTGAIREAVIRLSTNPAKPYWMLSWRSIRSR
jgi:hypothetical protein